MWELVIQYSGIPKGTRSTGMGTGPVPIPFFGGGLGMVVRTFSFYESDT